MLLNCGVGLLRVPWTARKSNQSILKEISPEYSLEELMLKLKLQYFGHLMWRANSFEKTLMMGDWRREKGMTEDEMVGWHHWLNGHECVQALGVGDGQGSLACCCPWDQRESDMTEWLNWLINREEQNLTPCWLCLFYSNLWFSSLFLITERILNTVCTCEHT